MKFCEWEHKLALVEKNIWHKCQRGGGDIFGTWRDLVALYRGPFQSGLKLAHPDQDVVGYGFL